MAAKTLYFLPDTIASGSTRAALQDGGSAPSTADATAGWVVGSTPATRYCWFVPNTLEASGQFGASVLPNSGSIGLSRGFRTQNPISGTFANSSWTFDFKLRSTVVGSTTAQQDAITIRVFKSTDPAATTGMTELTSALVQGTTATGNTTEQGSTVTWTPGTAITLVNEYLFVSVAMVTVVAAFGANQSTADWKLRTGSAAIITTPSFDQAMLADLAAVSSVTAGLTTSIRPAMDLAAQAAVTADLSTSIKAAAALASSATLTAALTTIPLLRSSPVASATLTAALTTQIKLVTAATAQSSLGAALTTAQPIAASLAAQATLAAGLTAPGRPWQELLVFG